MIRSMTPHVGPTYWPIEGRAGRFLIRDHVAEQDGWAWVQVNGPWMAEASMRTYHEFNAGYATYSDVRRDLEFTATACHARAKAVLQASGLQGELVLCTPSTDRFDPMAFVIFAVSRGLAPDQIGLSRFEAFKSRLPEMERLTMLQSGNPKAWPLSMETGARQQGKPGSTRPGFLGRLFGQ